MEFLSVRQKQGIWSGSHMVNTKANQRGYSSRLVGTLEGLCPSLPCISSALWSSRQRRQTGCEMLSQPGEGKDYQDTEVESGWPVSTALQQLHQPLHPHGRRSWPRDAWHTEPCTTPAKPLQPHPQTSLQLPILKILHHHSLAQTKPSVFWPAVEGLTTVVGLQRKTWGTWKQLPRAWQSVEAAISAGVLHGKGFFCFHLWLFLLHCIPMWRPVTTAL